MIGARLEFGEQAQGDQLHAGDDQQDAQKENRAVQGDVEARDPLVREPPRDQRAERRHREADQPENLQRPRRVTQKELDRQQIEDDPNRPADPVLRAAMPARA